ncbi:hypothetical protein [Mycobacterium ulcerans]|uniref:hypothetical protein n=1 Tax=Mycobacterium ulcerans TaxID=1809 RepID=UPI00214BC7CF|nr:hypothetical protein [Mycobacterium ulcerans]
MGGIVYEAVSTTLAAKHLEQVTAIAVEAGKLTLKYRQNPEVTEKGDHGDDTSPVTQGSGVVD